MARLNLDYMSPLPDNLPDARDEILRLRHQLLQANEKLANWHERLELDTRSLKGQVQVLQRRLNLLTAPASSVLKQVRKHFEAHKCGWFSKQDILEELDGLK